MARQILDNLVLMGEQRQKINDNFLELYTTRVSVGGDISGTATNPIVSKINGVTISAPGATLMTALSVAAQRTALNIGLNVNTSVQSPSVTDDNMVPETHVGGLSYWLGNPTTWLSVVLPDSSTVLIPAYTPQGV